MTKLTIDQKIQNTEEEISLVEKKLENVSTHLSHLKKHLQMLQEKKANQAKADSQKPSGGNAMASFFEEAEMKA